MPRIGSQRVSYRVKRGVLYGMGLWLAFDTVLGLTMLTLPDHRNAVELSDYSKEILSSESTTSSIIR